MNDNVIYNLSKKFALRIVKLYKYLIEEKHEKIISKQVFRCGTSIGANLAESKFAQSDADYLHKLKISLGEANETQFWIELLHDSDIIVDKEFDSISNDIKTIIGTLVNIINKLEGRR